ncbi:MAG: hypothetical protein J0H73_13660 [Salana multivorans]|uniref:hypothetical protein n=1 Tax=Salana multivorans TaxID=120377 RepID=UPI0009685C82|nr:hypothetical protein [Salana multivorans]MBN8883346.1 hypothetical protein [Salana multivorans]OJX98432.1 MAG: hypothetical protein BGO96_04530 [Micrococcales bacterium 73-15]
MTTITIQPGQPGQGMDYDVHQPLPYPFHIDADTGDCVHGRGTDWSPSDVPLGADPWRLIGFQAEQDRQHVDVLLEKFVTNPELAVGKWPVFIDHRGRFFSLSVPITSARTVEAVAQ